MQEYDYPNFPVSNGYLTEKIRQQYIAFAVKERLLPENAHRMAHVVSLEAANDPAKPIQFWQLYSVLGPQRIVSLVGKFYDRVYSDEDWFSSVFARISGKQHHVNTQSAMWIDAMGGGLAYHGGEYRLSFHHTHNAMQLMNDRGARRWVTLMRKTLDDETLDLTDDSRVRPAINTFLAFFLRKYASEFRFQDCSDFGLTNPALKRRINLMNMSEDAIAALEISELRDALKAKGVDVSLYPEKQQLIEKALML